MREVTVLPQGAKHMMKREFIPEHLTVHEIVSNFHNLGERPLPGKSSPHVPCFFLIQTSQMEMVASQSIIPQPRRILLFCLFSFEMRSCLAHIDFKFTSNQG